MRKSSLNHSKKHLSIPESLIIPEIAKITLPEGVWQELFSFLSYSDLASLATLNKTFQNFIKIFIAKAISLTSSSVVIKYLEKQGLSFIEYKHVFEGITIQDTEKLLSAIMELDRRVVVHADGSVYYEKTSSKAIEFLRRNSDKNSVAGYYYACYLTADKVSFKDNSYTVPEESELLAACQILTTITSKNPAAYFLLAELPWQFKLEPPPGVKDQQLFYFCSGLKALGFVIDQRCLDLHFIKLNRYIFRPLLFFKEKNINLLLNIDSTVKFDIIFALTHGTAFSHNVLFHNFIFNANINVLDFLIATKIYTQLFTFQMPSLTFLRLLAHPIVGDELLKKIVDFKEHESKKRNFNKNRMEEELTNYLIKMKGHSADYLSFFDQSPAEIENYSLYNIENVLKVTKKIKKNKKEISEQEDLNVKEPSTKKLRTTEYYSPPSCFPLTSHYSVGFFTPVFSVPLLLDMKPPHSEEIEDPRTFEATLPISQFDDPTTENGAKPANS